MAECEAKVSDAMLRVVCFDTPEKFYSLQAQRHKVAMTNLFIDNFLALIRQLGQMIKLLGDV